MDAESHHELTDMEHGKNGGHVYAYYWRYYDFDKCAFHYRMRKKVAEQFRISESTVNRVMKKAATFADPKSDLCFLQRRCAIAEQRGNVQKGSWITSQQLNATHKKDSSS